MKIAILDDHRLIRMGIKSALAEHHIMVDLDSDDARDIYALLDTLDNVQRSNFLLLLDIIMPKQSGIEVVRHIRENYDGVKILILSSDTRENTLTELLEAGIEGFISKNGADADLVNAIDCIIAGATYFGEDIAHLIRDITNAHEPTQLSQLTQREKEIISLSCSGMIMKEIADSLHVSPRTIEVHKTHIFQKLGLNNQIELLRFAINRGLITLN